VSPRTRTLRYGAAIAVALVGVAWGVLIPGTAGGTAATVLVGIGLVGVVSLIFYEVGLTEDREREAGARRHSGKGAGKEAEKTEPRSPDDHDAPGEHQGGRVRPLDRRRGQRRRLR
jgi:hypothetical protein